MIFKWLIKIFVALNGSSNPIQIGCACASAFLVACIPQSSPLPIAILAVAFFTRINMVVMLVALPLFRLLTPVFDGFIDFLGYSVLTSGAFSQLFSALAEIPVLPLSGFNQTLVAGGLIFGLAAFVPAALATVFLVKLYRKNVRDRISDSKLGKAFLNIPQVASIINAVTKARSTYMQ